MDPALLNCILAVCCDPFSENRTLAMGRLLVKHGMDPEDAQKYAPIVLDALQPLFEAIQPFVDLIAKLARGDDFKP